MSDDRAWLVSGRAYFGYLLVHFIEDPAGYGERIYFTLSEGDTPLVWTRANRGAPVLASDLGTTGVRDPYLVRGDGEFFLIATDLRCVGGNEAGWDSWVRTGSRSLVVWRSIDLVVWSEPWLAEVAPPTAGMAWAPEATFDQRTGEFVVYWSSNLYADSDSEHAGASYSRVLVARTRDFRSFTEPEILIDRGRATIDTTIVQWQGQVHRFSKDDSRAPDSAWVFHEVGRSIDADDFRTIATKIAADRGEVEAPLVFRDHLSGQWYLWVDQYSTAPQGYIAYRSDALESGDWRPVPEGDFVLPPHSKHGVVLPLRDGEWERLRAAYPV